MMKTIAVSKSSLNGAVDASKLNLTKQHPISCNISSKQYNQETTFSSPYLSNSKKFHAPKINLKNCSTDDNEISIFDAQKYFNEGNEQSQNHTIKASSPLSNAEKYNLSEFPRYSSMSSSSIDTSNARNYTMRSLYATPTAFSEASWNSQTGLLSNPPGTIKVSLHHPTPIPHKTQKTNTQRWFFGRNGKKSTQVNNKAIASETKSPTHFRSITPTNLSNSPAHNTITLNIQRSPTKKDRDFNNVSANGFSFPILNPSPKYLEEPPRDSLEIFNPSINNNQIPKTTTDKVIEDEEDAASDGSSDLFELESFANQSTTPYQFYNNINLNNFLNGRRLSIITSNNSNGYRRNSTEEPATPSVAATEGYEPSELSIGWSVTTAEGFERASVATYDEMMRDDGGGGGDAGRRNGGSVLLGFSCRSETAVLEGLGPRRVGLGLVGGVAGSQLKSPLAGRPMNR